MQPITRACDECGKSYEAKTARSKYCGGTCRVAGNRRPNKVGKARAAREAAAKAAPADGVVDLTPPAPTYDTLADQVKITLTELEALDTISGMAALRVAQQIDRGGDSGAAVATLSKELSRLVGEAKVESAPKRKDAADDIMARAGEKLLQVVR